MATLEELILQLQQPRMGTQRAGSQLQQRQPIAPLQTPLAPSVEPQVAPAGSDLTNLINQINQQARMVPTSDINAVQRQAGGQTGVFGTTNVGEQVQTQEQNQLAQLINQQQQEQTTEQQQTQTRAGTVDTGTQTTARDVGVTEQTQDQQQRGVTRTGLEDTLGLGGLIESSAQDALTADTARNEFLSGLVTGEDNGFNQRIEAAINQAVSGPGMVGVGEGGRSRVAGAAAADIAREDTAQRLAASAQQAGPTARTTAVGAGIPLLASTQETAQDIRMPNQTVEATVDTAPHGRRSAPEDIKF